MDSETLDIIVPCYNPSNDWERDLCDNYTSLKNHLTKMIINLILINDGSTKGLKEDSISLIKKEIGEFNYINYPENKGKGYALRQGVAKSKADYIIFTDIDFPYQTESILNIYNELHKGTDVVLGDRNSNYYSKTPKGRKIISKTFKTFLKVFLKLKVTDTQCGLKGFNKKGKEEFLKTTIDRFLFDLEFVKRCSQKNNLKIKAVPVKLKDNVVFSKMDFKILAREFYNFIIVLIKN